MIALGLKLGLTNGEQRVFSRILLGETYREIAANLGCTVKNVEFHVSNILRRAHARSMKKLVAEMRGDALG
ncbi:MAG TPA: LuxR C-terminal-related transcriptional regulator [Polyangiaceae bacterium]